MSNTQQILKNLNVQAAETFVHSVRGVDNYFVYAARHLPFDPQIDGGTDINPPAQRDTARDIALIYDNLLFGKRVRADQVANMIRRIPWVDSTVYSMYSDIDPELSSKQFYVTVDDGIDINVYKCLFNNNGQRSTQRPFGKSLEPIEFPQDGYIWKYMYTIDTFNARQFATQDYVPTVVNPDVTAAAIPGALDVIVVDDPGIGYSNYTFGVFTDPSTIAVGSNLRFALQSNASDRPTFYTNCIIKMITGPATGEYKTIVDYVIEDGRKIIVLDQQFVNRPGPGDRYEIYPKVFINDVSGTSVDQCDARAIIDPSTGDSVSRVEVLTPGSLYRVATAELRPANIVAVTIPATIRPIVAPPGGHGSNINNELYGSYAGISATFSGDNEPLVAANDYRSVGLIRNPLFADIRVKIDSTKTVGVFQRGERVLRYRPLTLQGTVDLTVDGVVEGTETNFVDTLRTGDTVILNNGVTNFYAQVRSINNETSITLDRAPQFASTNNTLTLVVGEYFGTVSSFEIDQLDLTNVVPTGFGVSSFLVGEQSSATTKVDDVEPNVLIGTRQAADFGGFNQLTTLVGSFATTTRFVQDEPLFQAGSIDPVAIVHSAADNPGSGNDLFYVSNVSQNLKIQGEMGSTGTLRGGISNALFIARDKYIGEIVPDSGEVLYVENVSPITRTPRQTETFKLILSF